MSRERKFGDSRVIITEALRLIEEEGYLSFSTRRLAARLGLTAMSLYTYYDSRERLLEDAVTLGFEEFIAGMTEFFARRGGAGTLRGLRVVSEYMVKFAHERTNVYRFLFSSDLTALHGDPRMKRYSNYILEDIQRTHPEGELSKDLKRRVGLFMTLVNALIVDLLEGRGLIDKEDIDNSLGLGYDLILKPVEETIEAMRAVGGSTAAAADAMRG